MADHTIKFQAPEFELGGRDIRFLVYINGKKQGEFLVSEGGLDWWPKNSKRNMRTKTWSELRDFMES
jgi:hypothetical protein